MKRFLFIAFLTSILFASSALAGAWEMGSVTNASGTRNYKLWIPRGVVPGKTLPLVMMLHGCQQTPDDFAAGTDMNSLADQYRFFVVYPEQPSSANSTNCWNWFLPEHQARDAGEPSILAGIVRKIQETYGIQNNRIFVAGMSAGAAMSVIMAATYPDIFSAVGVSAGLEYKAANDLTSALIAQQRGGLPPDEQGKTAFEMSGNRAHRMPTIVFHGSLDQTVNVANGAQVIQQWAQTNDFIDDGFDNNSVDAAADDILAGTAPNGGLNYTRYIYRDAQGQTLLEYWLVDTMLHRWSGGSSAGSYTEPRGPNASYEMIRFFGLNVSRSKAL
ncbi:MAG TPA: PHB depolymerase family esterase [Pyrinomonadaceae bacterium]|jgi:poly(hydroxyalkanoate) depolymerase family esterase